MKRTEYAYLHGHSKKLMLGCGDDDISTAQNFEVVLFTGHAAPVENVAFQSCPGLSEDLCLKFQPHEWKSSPKNNDEDL